ncbi:hypothetical protein V6N13_112354 [Hibiscus sabdariffa]|uniref:Acidic leucine-rich nuclear phosphoprotein 32-related protein n=1 Tax=Hibiscus sabdariffa TaxID=183260 RepID=A0ABR2TNH9_9ROSI
MDEIWERAVETALDGHTDHTAARTLTLDGAVKCVQGRLPPPSLLEKFENLQHLSIANIGVSSLEQFPRLRNLQKLILSDNRISGGLEFLVEAGLDSLRDLDLSNNRIQYIEDLAPLAQLKLVSLDLYECPVTRVKDYRSRVFGLIKSLKYLDKMDAEGNERPESDEEEEDEEEEEEEEDEDDPGNGEIDGEDRLCKMNNGHSKEEEGIADVDEDEDEDEESDADVEETEIGRRISGQNHAANGFHIGQVGRDDEDEDDDDDVDDDENVSDEEVDDDDEEEEEEEEEEDIVEAHEIGGSDDEEDGVEDDEEEEVDNDEMDFAEPVSTGGLTSTEGEIDGHEHGDDGDGDDDDGETGEEEEQGVENDEEFEDEEEGEEEDDDYGEGYLVQPVGQAEEHDVGGSDMEPVKGEEEVEDDEEVLPSSSQLKRKRSGDDDEDVDDDVEFTKSSKKHG